MIPRRRQTRHRRRAPAQKRDMAQPVALQRDRARAISPRLHRRAELGHEVTQPGLQTVARYPQTLDPAIGRRVRLRVADDDGRRIGRRVIRHDRLQQRRRHLGLVAVHVRPGARAADVDPAYASGEGRLVRRPKIFESLII